MNIMIESFDSHQKCDKKLLHKYVYKWEFASNSQSSIFMYRMDIHSYICWVVLGHHLLTINIYVIIWNMWSWCIVYCLIISFRLHHNRMGWVPCVAIPLWMKEILTQALGLTTLALMAWFSQVTHIPSSVIVYNIANKFYYSFPLCIHHKKINLILMI